MIVLIMKKKVKALAVFMKFTVGMRATMGQTFAALQIRSLCNTTRSERAGWLSGNATGAASV